jgi:hypothetical protein
MKYTTLENFGTEALNYNELMSIDGGDGFWGDVIGGVVYGAGYIYGTVEHAIENVVGGMTQAAKDRNPNK